MGNKTEIRVIEKGDRRSHLAPLEELLSHQFTIPLFQRPYAWDAEHFKDLLVTIIENRTENREAFLGSVIVARTDKNSPTLNQYLLIDGQQRITSFLILLKFTLMKLKDSIKNLKQEISHIQKLIQKLKKESKSNQNFDEFEKLITQENTKKSVKVEYEKAVTITEKIVISDKIKRESVSEDTLEKDVLNYISRPDTVSNDSTIEKMQEIFDTKIEEVQDIPKFLKYILKKCNFCFLVVTGDNSEDYAIDIFNSLNSTGEPLTAFEILKSSIHKKFKNNNSVQKELTGKFNNIEKKLQERKFKKIKQNKYTDRLLLFIHMMIAELHNITKTSSFRDKKKLIDEILKLEDEKIKKCVDTIYHIHSFILENWESKNPFKNKQLDLESKVTFSFLQSIGHDRVLPILYKFKDSTKDLNDAIKICVAFTCLWRGSSTDGKTDRIDKKYEELIKFLFKEQKGIEDLKHPVIEKVKKKEQEVIMDQEKWVNKFKKVDIYKSRKLARFLLFIAFHWRNFNPETKKLDKSKLKFLNSVDDWNGKEYRTIEHIVPQSYKKIDKIGNLILLPQGVNTKVGSGNFLEKKKEYQKCIDDDPNDMPYIPVLKEVVSYKKSEELDENSHLKERVIDFRGEKLGNSIWETLAEDWLGWKD